MSLQCVNRHIERLMNTYRKNKEFNPVNKRCEILVIGLSSRILISRNISNIRDICEIKPASPQHLAYGSTHLLCVLPYLAHLSLPWELFLPSVVGATLSSKFLQLPSHLSSWILIVLLSPCCLHLLLDLTTQVVSVTSGYLGLAQTPCIECIWPHKCSNLLIDWAEGWTKNIIFRKSQRVLWSHGVELMY